MINIQTIYFKYLIGILLLLLFSSCEGGKGIPAQKPKPSAFGKANEIVVISDRDMWEGRVGDTLDFYLSSAYPILPAPEPIFDLRYFSPEDLEEKPIRKELRTLLIIADLEDSHSPVTKMLIDDIGEERYNRAMKDSTVFNSVGSDKWAQGQMIIYLYGRGQENIISNIKKSWKSIADRVGEFDAKQIEANIYLPGYNREIENVIRNKYGIGMKIPKSYFIAVNEENDLWIRLETDKYSANFIMRKEKYESEEQLTKAYMKALQDSLGLKYVSTAIEGTYKRTNDIDLPMFTERIKDREDYTLESRGIWEMEGDFLGGAFISRMILSPQQDSIFFAEAFLYAPGRDKRNTMQELHYILSTADFIR